MITSKKDVQYSTQVREKLPTKEEGVASIVVSPRVSNRTRRTIYMMAASPISTVMK